MSTRNEDLLKAILNDEDVSDWDCKTENEVFLKSCATGSECDSVPKTRNQQLLKQLAHKIATKVGAQPQLNPITISNFENDLTVTPNSENGNFVAGYEIYANGEKIGETENVTYTITGMQVGDNYTVTVKAKGTNFLSSDDSNEVNISLYGVTQNLENCSTDAGDSSYNTSNKSLQVSVDNGYELNIENISVTVGGIEVTDFTWEDPMLTIPTVNGAIVLNLAATIKLGVTKVEREIAPLSEAKYAMGTASVGNYALFGGGYGVGGVRLSTVDAYDTELTRTTATVLSIARSNLSATTVGNYALFGGGYSTSYSDTVDAYDTELTRTIPTALIRARYDLAATTVGDYALFGGGYSSTSYSYYVDAYDTELTRTTATVLNIARSNLSATTVGNYALFGGGRAGGCLSFVEAYDTELTRTTATAFSESKMNVSVATFVGYALFGGGNMGGNRFINIEAYDTELIRTIPATLSIARCYLAATTVCDYALFGGGNIGDQNLTSIVDVYDSEFIRTTTSLSIQKDNLSSTTVGNYALFGGGYKANSILDSNIDAYTV